MLSLAPSPMRPLHTSMAGVSRVSPVSCAEGKIIPLTAAHGPSQDAYMSLESRSGSYRRRSRRHAALPLRQLCQCGRQLMMARRMVRQIAAWRGVTLDLRNDGAATRADAMPSTHADSVTLVDKCNQHESGTFLKAKPRTAMLFPEMVLNMALMTISTNRCFW